MSVLVFFRKSYVKAHQRRLKSGQVITIPAHYDKRTKKGADAPLAHGHDLRHLDAAKRAVFEKMHAEQHLLHHYHAHALRRRVQEQQGHLEGLAKQVADHRAAGRHVEAAKTENQRLRLHSRHRVNQRELDDIEQRLAGLAGMKEALVQGSGAIDASTDDSHKAYAAKLGERFKARAKPEPKPAVKPQEYRYALANRPFGIGTAPKEGWVRTEPRPAEGEDHHGLARHGFAIYSRPLTDKETSGFELTPIVTVDEHAKRLVAKMGRYAGKYAEPANAELLTEYVTQHAGSVGVASTDDMAALQQRVLAQIGKAAPVKPAAPPFTPTHELPDGTPVRATGEKGVYTDASGAEIEDDYAKPIKAAATKPPVVVTKPAAPKPEPTAKTPPTAPQPPAGVWSSLADYEKEHSPLGVVPGLLANLAGIKADWRTHSPTLRAILTAADGKVNSRQWQLEQEQTHSAFANAYRHAYWEAYNAVQDVKALDQEFPKLKILDKIRGPAALDLLQEVAAKRSPGQWTLTGYVDESKPYASIKPVKVTLPTDQKAKAKVPQEGDTKSENGIDYVLKDGRWHRTTPEATGLRYDPATNRHSGKQLVRGDVLQGADGKRYTLDRDMGFSLQVDALGPDGRIVPASTRTISVDPSDKDRFLDVSLTGENLFDAKATAPKVPVKPKPKTKPNPTHYRVNITSPFGEFQVYVAADKDAIPSDYLKDAKTAFLHDSGGGTGFTSSAQVKVVGDPVPVTEVPAEASAAKNAEWARIAKVVKPEAPAVPAKAPASKTKAPTDFDPAAFIKIAADDVSRLRASDVDRLFAEAPRTAAAWTALSSYLLDNRKDLLDDVLAAQEDNDPPEEAADPWSGGETPDQKAQRETANQANGQRLKDYLAAGGNLVLANPRRVVPITHPDHLRVGQDGVYLREGSKWAFLLTTQVDELVGQMQAKPVTPTTDDLDPSSPNYRYRDTGYVGGSRKELAAAMLRTAKRDGTQVRKNDVDWETLEANPREAKEVITKSHLFGTVDWEGLKAQGLTPGAGFVLDRVYASVGTGPRDDTPQARQDYALGLETLRNRLEACRTPEEIEKTLAELKEERDGVNLNAEETARFQELEQQAEAAYAPVHAYKRQEYELDKAVSIAHRVFYAAESPAGHRRGGKYTADQQADIDKARAGLEAAQQAKQALVDAHPEMQEQAVTINTPKGTMTTWTRPADKAWRRIRQQQDVLVADATARNQVESPLLRAWSQLGERFNAVLDHRTSKGSDTFLNHLATAKLGRIKDWSWQKTTQTGTKAPRQVTEEGKRFQLQVADSHERVGGRSVAVASTADLKERFGLREVQSGNWVLRDPVSAKFHTEQTAGALADLADILGITDQQVAMNGRVALAFGARGTGNAGGVAARAHYEPVGRVINLTKMGGGGCLAHEWLHGLDNLLLESQGGTAGADDFLTRQPSLLPPGPLRNAFQGLQDALKTGQHRIKQRLIYTPEHYRQAQQNIARTHMPEGMRDYGLPNAARIIKEARDASTALDKLDILYEPLIARGQRGAKKHLADWRNVALAYHGGQPEGGSLVVETGKPQSSFAMEAVKLDNGAAGKYWSRTEELAARAFQSYVEDKLTSQGRRNDYLSAKADNKYYRMDGTAPFPEGEERTRINAAFDKLIAAMQADNSLAKALARTRYPRRLVVFRKSYVHGHYRKNPKTGEMVWVESFSDKRTTKQGMTLFAHDLHRQDHFKQNLAEGRLREAMHSFHDLDHDAAHKLAGTLGLHHGAKHADKKELMRAVRSKVLQQQQDYQDQVKAQEAKAKGKGPAAKPAVKPAETPPPAKPETKPAAKPVPADATETWQIVMDYVENHLGSESVFEFFDYLPERPAGDLRWTPGEVVRAQHEFLTARNTNKHAKAKQSLLDANGGSPLGIEAKKPDSNRHALILPDASSPGKYRYSAYDEHGFYTHATHATADQALDEAIKEGFTEHAPGSLDRLSQTDTWAQGMQRAAEAQAGWKAPAQAPEAPPEAPAAKTTDHLFDQEAHGPQVRYHVTAAGAAIAKEGFKPMTTGGVGVAGGTDGHTFTYRDRQDAKNLLDDLNNMEAVRVAPDPLAVAAKLTGMSQDAIRQAGDRLKEGWDQYFRKKLGGRDCTDRDVALHSASNYVPFTSFASVTGPRRAFGIVPVDVSHAQRIGGEKDGEERWDPATIKPILSKQAAQTPPAVTQPDPEDQVLDINGAEVPYAWQLVDAEDLAPTSEKADNQFRDRTRAASDEQVASMAANLKFRLLSDSPLMDYGAPVLAQDGKTIIGGNGRSLAIRRAYGMGQAAGYKHDLAKRAARFGIDPAAVAKLKAPVLVRVLQQDVDIKQAAIASNEGGGARMSALEQARVDGERLGDLSDFEADEEGNFNTRANLPFIRRFLGTMPVAQRSAFQAADGGLSQEGISRLRNAVLYRAYGDSDVLSRLVESADPAQRNVLSALTRAAPTVAQASADVKAGNLHDLDVSADIVAATTLLAQVRGEGKFGSVDEYLNQQNLFGDPLSDATKIILKHFDRNLRSSKAMAGFLTDYYAAVRQIGDPKQMGMFADATPDKPTLLRQTDAQRQNAPSPQAALF